MTAMNEFLLCISSKPDVQRELYARISTSLWDRRDARR